MKTAYITIHRGKNPPPQNGSRLKSVFLIKSTGFTSSTFPTQPDFSQNQPDVITLNICSSLTLIIIIVALATSSSTTTRAMSGENRYLVHWRPVGFVKSPVELGK
jgi:hypothetical protein